MNIVSQLQTIAQAAILSAYGKDVSAESIVVNATRPDMAGDFTIVTFALSKLLGDRPDAIAQKVGEKLVSESGEVASVEVVKGFLNVSLASSFWRKLLLEVKDQENFGFAPKSGTKTMIEFASPNTNKPLHLGHVRNILLGWSTSRILEAVGHEVVRVQIINDRGIAICKSMLAWHLFGNGATPQSTGVKGDHFVGDYYVKFEQAFQEEYKAWQASENGRKILDQLVVKDDETPAKKYKNTYFNEHSALGSQARKMLLDWEAGDKEVRDLWSKMNGWVYDGFGKTYDRLGVSFDKLYYESDTYLLGKEMVDKGLSQGKFYRKEDGSVWVDLSAQKLDHKLVLRSDGTSVYITQDIGTANQRYEDFGVDRMIYVVADEQNYHFEVLFKTLKLLDEPYAKHLYHLNYGMIDLTTGKMKSREGTVVDADDLMDEVVGEARKNADERAEITESDEATRKESAEQVGLAAIKYYILRVGPKKRMTFDPKESVELQGATGPYIQYSYVRANGVSTRAAAEGFDCAKANAYEELAEAERELVKHLLTFPAVLEQSAADLDPSQVAGFAYNLAKGYHRFWHDHSVLSAENEEARAFRIALSQAVAKTLKSSMDLLGIQLPERM